MIESFKSEESRKVFDQTGSRRLPFDIQGTAYRRLVLLHRSLNLSDIASIPGNRFEQLTGDRAGQYSIRINNQWRICFRWTTENNAGEVEIVDYH